MHRIDDPNQLGVRGGVVAIAQRRELEGADEWTFASARNRGIEVRTRRIQRLPLPHQPVREHHVRVDVVRVDRESLLVHRRRIAGAGCAPLQESRPSEMSEDVGAARMLRIEECAIQGRNDHVGDAAERLVGSRPAVF
jgi:hypothetical protein